MAYLMRKRFNLEWYIEGGRSRTGKLRPPRYGLLAYLVEAFRERRRGRRPARAGVDRLRPAATRSGRWPPRSAARRRRRRASAGSSATPARRAAASARCTCSFGEPLSLRDALAEDSAAGTRRGNDVEKVAFEVCHRIGRATPITPTSLVTLALLGVEDRALTLREGRSDPRSRCWSTSIARGLPTTGDVGLRTTEVARGGRSTRSVASGVVTPLHGRHRARVRHRAPSSTSRPPSTATRPSTSSSTARSPSWRSWRAPPRRESANVVERGVGGGAAAARPAQVRLLLPPQARRSPRRSAPRWRILDPGLGAAPDRAGGGARRCSRERRCTWRTACCGPFLEAYQVVADRLAGRDPGPSSTRTSSSRDCIGLGRQYRLQRRLYSPESISKELFARAAPGGQPRAHRARAATSCRPRGAAFAAEIRRRGAARRHACGTCA